MSKRIVVIGANGQVGSEVCLMLRLMRGVEVVPVCRTEIGSAFLRRCGFAVRHGSVGDAKQAPRLLEGADVVADFSLPTGSASEVQTVMRQLIPTVMQSAPRGVPVAYMSSITAFGIPDFHQPLREYRFSRNMYGACKREGEKLAASAAHKNNRPAYVLRVGVVHGELQAVSRQTLEQVRLRAGVTTWIPDGPSFTVFAFSIAETLLGIVHGRETPGQYTMLSNPAWTWRDVHEWYCRRAGVEPDVQLLAPEPPPQTPGLLHNLVFAKKDVISAYVSASSPALENHLRGVYHLRTASREIAAGLRNAQYRPYGNNHTEFPGTRPQSISDSRITMEPVAAQVREQVASLTRQRMSMAGAMR